MTSRNVKSTWELAGRLSGSFSDSTKRAQTQLGQLRREYRQNQGELRRMQSVMRTAAAGTDAYSNAQRRIPQIQDDLTRQAFAIGAVEKEALGGAPSPGASVRRHRKGGRRPQVPGDLRHRRRRGNRHRGRRGCGPHQGAEFHGPAGPEPAGAVNPGDRYPVLPAGRQPTPDPERRCGHRQASDTVGGRRLPVLRPAPGLQPQFLPR